MKVWITKYALTEGVLVFDGSVSESYPTMVTIRRSPAHYWETFHGNDWHTTWEAALERAEQMRAAKLLSLEKQRKKLMTLEFVNPDKEA